MMFISVIMAVYNGGKYLKEAIASVFDQKYKNFEFIIVDDASTDGTQDIIQAYLIRHADQMIAIRNTTNIGQGPSFNRAVQKAKGEVVCFLDADDLWFKDKLLNVNHVCSGATQYAFLQHNLYLLCDSKITKQKFTHTLITGDCLRYSQKTNIIPIFIPTSGLTFRTDIIRRVLPIPDTFITCADGYLTRTCCCFGDVLATPECWGAYRIHADNNTFENSDFDQLQYRNEILYPALNAFFQGHDIDLFYGQERKRKQKKQHRSWLQKLFTVSPRVVLKKFLPRKGFEWLDKRFHG